MRECKKKKRLQIYLDGWMSDREARRFEEHLKNCGACQGELINIEEISSSALEIVDHAPEREYWDSFFTRVHNRIISRGAELEPEKKKTFSFKAASYTIGIMSIAAALLLTFNYLTKSPVNQPVTDRAALENTTELKAVSSNNPLESASVKPTDTEPAEIITLPPAVKTENKIVSQPKIDEGGSSTVDRSGVKPENDADIERNLDFVSAFRDPYRMAKAKLSLSDGGDDLDRLYAVYGSLARNSFSVNPDVIAERIISGPSLASGARGAQLSTARSGVIGAENPRWGYSGLPADTSGTEISRRYSIELELMLVK